MEINVYMDFQTTARRAVTSFHSFTAFPFCKIGICLLNTGNNMLGEILGMQIYFIHHPHYYQLSVYLQIKIKLKFSMFLAIEVFYVLTFQRIEPEQLIKFRIKKKTKNLSFLTDITVLLLPGQGKKKMLEQIQYMTEIWEILGNLFTCCGLTN